MPKGERCVKESLRQSWTAARWFSVDGNLARESKKEERLESKKGEGVYVRLWFSWTMTKASSGSKFASHMYSLRRSSGMSV